MTFFRTARSILQEFHQQQQRANDANTEKGKIIEAAANLIKTDIKSVNSSFDKYPSKDDLTAESAVKFLPESLSEFLRYIFAGKDNNLKIASIGQAIMQAARPRVLLSPLQFGLAIQMHNHFSSRFVVDSLFKHGFACSYSEVQRYERSAAITQGAELPKPEAGQFIQFMADNVDHNIRSIDGFNTFHGMGIISSFTPGTVQVKPVPRIKVSSIDIVEVGRINIKHFTSQHTGKPPMTYKELQAMEVTDPTASVDLLWDVSLSLQSSRPAWSGMMQSVHRGSYPGKSTVLFLPMIDMDPSNMTCVYSTLSYVSEQAGKYGITPILTFDQPLWFKATMIVEAEPDTSPLKSIVLRLGGLHVEMSFLGSIGHLMAGSGLQEVLQVAYAENAVKHMLSGKAIARAIRGHLLVYAALNAMLMAKAYDIPLLESSVDGESQSVQEPD